MSGNDQQKPAEKRHPSPAAKVLDGLNIVCIVASAIITLGGFFDVVCHNKFATDRKENRLYFCDFAKYYVCGHLAVSQDRQRVYDPEVQGDYTVRYALGNYAVKEEFIHYPPIDFPLTAPLAALPIEQAYLAFSLVGSALLLASTYLLNQATGCIGKARTMIIFWLAVFGSLPMLRTIIMGQTSVFLAGIIALYCLAFLKNRPILAGLALALTSIKPQYSVFLVAPALVQKRYKLILSAAICELLLILAAVADVGLKNVIDYPSILYHSEQNVALAGAFVGEMVNMRGILANIFSDPIAAKGATGLMILAWFWLSGIWHKFGHAAGGDETTQKLLLAATVTFALTFSPHTHLYDCVFLAVPALLAGASSMSAVSSSNASKKEKLVQILFLAYPFAGWLFIEMPLPPGSLHTLPFAIYNLIFCVALVSAVVSGAPALKEQDCSLPE